MGHLRRTTRKKVRDSGETLRRPCDDEYPGGVSRSLCKFPYRIPHPGSLLRSYSFLVDWVITQI